MFVENQSKQRVLPYRKQALLWPTSDGLFENYPDIEDTCSFRDYFQREGFILVRNAVPKELCEAAKYAFLSEVKPDRSFFRRHESGALERHVFTEAGFMKYPIMNIQDISGRKFPHFKEFSLDVLTQPKIRHAVMAIIGEPGCIIHTMYFDGNQVTWAHRDGHYIDAERTGQMLGIWVAAEDIHPDAGRFFICPRSHLSRVPGELEGDSADPNGKSYKALMADFVENSPFECVAPELKQGDMLMWSSMTIHGSMPTTEPQFSRRSFTAHYIPASENFLWYSERKNLGERHNRIDAAHKENIAVNGVLITRHENQNSFKQQLRAALKAKTPRGLRVALRRVFPLFSSR
jgi:phytanoyl-CoA hydroxylase